MQVDKDSTAGVVSCRHHGNPLFCHVDLKLDEPLIDGRKMIFDKGRISVRDIKIDVISTNPLHFMINRTRHDVAWSKFSSRVEAWHKPRAIG